MKAKIISKTKQEDKDQPPLEFVWNDRSRTYHEFQFTGSPGVKVNVNDLQCPLTVLKTFLSDDLINSIVTHTNSYAELVKQLPEV